LDTDDFLLLDFLDSNDFLLLDFLDTNDFLPLDLVKENVTDFLAVVSSSAEILISCSSSL